MPEYITGLNSLKKLAELIAKYDSKKIMLITGKESYFASGAAAIIDEILSSNSVTRYSDFEVNPKIEDAERGVAIARENDVDLIVGVGGGSPMDMAKLIKAFYNTPENSAALVRGEIEMSKTDIPLVVVPTTAGSGSEATHFAVAYIGKEKHSLASPYLLPNGVILDGNLLSSSTPYQRAVNGLDALSQAIESAWAAGSTEESREYSFDAIERLVVDLPAVVADTADSDAFQSIMVASNLAGRAINISKTTAAHAWSYAFTGYHGVPHGHAVWLTLPKIFQIHAEAKGDQITDPRGEAHVSMVLNRVMTILGIKSAKDSAEFLNDFLVSIGIEPSMKAMGAKNVEQRKFLSEQVNLERMSNNPVALDTTAISAVFDI